MTLFGTASGFFLPLSRKIGFLETSKLNVYDNFYTKTKMLKGLSYEIDLENVDES